jgi:hypothetical protein
MNKYPVLACLLVSSGAFTQSQKPQQPKPVYFEQGMGLKEEKIDSNPLYPTAYNAPASIHVDRTWDVSANASFLFWYMSEEGLDLMHVTPVLETTGAVAYQNFNYNPGFQVGLGVHTNRDGWVVNAEYTWYHNKESQSNIIAPADVHGWTNNGMVFPAIRGTYKTFDSSWLLHLDQVDLVAGRPYYQGKRVIISPMGGLRGLWIRQTEKVVSHNPAMPDDYYTAGSHSWAVGPVAGANGRLMLWKGFRVDSLFAASLLYTNYTSIHMSLHNLTGTHATHIGHNYLAFDDITRARATVETGLGLGYGSYFWSKKFYLDLSLRYDFHLFWAQNMMRDVFDALCVMPAGAGDLVLHGLTINLRGDF